MKKLFILFIFLLLSSCSLKTNAITPVSIQATSYIVIEQSNNKMLEGSNYYEQRSVASISKIMTAIICIENSNVNEKVKVPQEINTVDGSSIYLKVDQEIYFMVYYLEVAMMLLLVLL